MFESQEFEVKFVWSIFSFILVIMFNKFLIFGNTIISIINARSDEAGTIQGRRYSYDKI